MIMDINDFSVIGITKTKVDSQSPLELAYSI